MAVPGTGRFPPDCQFGDLLILQNLTIEIMTDQNEMYVIQSYLNSHNVLCFKVDTMNLQNNEGNIIIIIVLRSMVFAHGCG